MQTKSQPQSGRKEQPYYLLADCGGTFLRLELRTRQNKILHRTDRRTAEFASLSEALKDFFSNFNVDHKNIMMCVSIAAKVLDNRVVAQSNIPWPMSDGNKLKEEFGSFCLTKTSKNQFCSMTSRRVLSQSLRLISIISRLSKAKDRTRS